MKYLAPTSDNGLIMTQVKPAMMIRPAEKWLPASETVASAVQLFINAPEGPVGHEIAAQLRLEMTDKFEYLAVNSAGESEKVEGTTKLGAIAVPKEIRTPRGLELVPTARIKVQAYMPVGRCVRPVQDQAVDELVAG